MGTAFSSNESVTQSPNRNRPTATVSGNRIYVNRSNQRIIDSNPQLPQRRASANVHNSYEDAIGYLCYDRNDPRRHIQMGSSPSTSHSLQNAQSRPFSFGGDLSTIRYSADLDSDHDRHSLNATRLFYLPYPGQDRKCSICKRLIPYDNFETHYVMCFTKPRVTFNEDVLTEDQGECVICLIELLRGDVIARLPCLCIYHKKCIEDWFQRSQTCPSHPDFIDSSR